MRITGKLVAIALSLCLLVGILSGCGTKSELTTLNLCEVTHSVFYAPQYVAMELGFFEEEGLAIELSTGEGADKVMSAVLSGDMDIGFAGPEACIYVYQEGKEDYMQVFAQMTQRDGSFLVARKPDDAFSWEKLKDKVLIPGRVGGVPYMTLNYVMRQNGLDPTKDLTLDSSIQFSMMAAAFTGGTGDYVSLFEPTASALEAEGKGYIVASIGAESGEIPYTSYFSTKSFLKENAEVIQSFTDAIYRAQQWVKEHTAEEIAEVIAPQFPNTDVSLLASSVSRYKEIDAWCDDPFLTEDSFVRLQEVMKQAGELEEAVPFDVIFDPTFAEKTVS